MFNPYSKTGKMAVTRASCICILVGIGLLQSCATYAPSNTDDICDIFAGNIRWYKAARKSEQRWGTPTGIMMAIIKQESSYRANVRPPRRWFLFIPLPRRSSAYGYAQAQDGTWSDYQRATGHHGHNRNNFGDAINFVGWYTDTSQRQLGISKWDPYSQYLAYHEGWGGFKRQSYSKKPELRRIATRVKRQAEAYNAQLKTCKNELERSAKRWF